uniref:Glycosyltransferase family 92 protein n=1 Tax=Steinernema glaseri TaxID=37863 RepID=A0A1I7Z737_9BILA
MIRPSCVIITLLVIFVVLNCLYYNCTVYEQEWQLFSYPTVFEGVFPLMVYTAYYHYLSNQSVGFSLIGYSYCRSKEEMTRLDIGGAIFLLRNDPLLGACPGHTGCDVGPYRLYAEIPAHITLPDKVKLITERTSIKAPVQRTVFGKRTTGFVACVSQLYWFNNWVRVVEFIEIYRSQDVEHFYIYVASVSTKVYSVLKYYEGLVST